MIIGIRPDDIKKEREENLRYLHIKGAYSSQELFDHHRGMHNGYHKWSCASSFLSSLSSLSLYSFNHKWCKLCLTILLSLFPKKTAGRWLRRSIPHRLVQCSSPLHKKHKNGASCYKLLLRKRNSNGSCSNAWPDPSISHIQC